MDNKTKPTLTGDQIAAFRLGRHYLADKTHTDLVAVSRSVCGIQAQVMPAAHMALWARMRALTRSDIHSALYKSRTLVKTMCMRQTLHLIPATEFSVYITALKNSRVEAVMRQMSKFGITRNDVDAMNAIVLEALRAGPVPQGQLRNHMAPRVGKGISKWMALVWNPFRPAIVEGLICYGPQQGQEVTLVRVDQWLPGQKEVSDKEAQQILFRQYLRAYGPASITDFARWSGISMKEVREIGERLKDELTEVSVEDRKGFVLRVDLNRLKSSALQNDVLHLLPSFDPYMLSHVDKNHLVKPQHYKRVYRNQGWISHVVLLNGRVIGVWSYTFAGKRLSLEIVPFDKISRPVRAKIEEKAASLGQFLETPWEIKFIP